MNEAHAVRKAPPQAQSSGSIHTLMTSRQPYMSEPIASKHVCFYKSGDAQFSGLPVVINNRTFKTFEALLDSLSKRVPLPFGVRTITTPRGHTAVRSLDQLRHGHSYICSDKRTVKPIDLERARRKPPPWYHARPVSSRRLARERQSPGPRSVRRARRNEHAALLHTPKRLVVFRNGDPDVKHTLLLQKRTTHSFEALLDLVSEVMHFPVLKLHTPDGRRVDGLPALILCSGVLVAAGREPFRKGNYDVQKPSAPTWLPAKNVGRRHPVSRKKKPMTSSTKSRPFSPSSERYIVNQIQTSFAGSGYQYPSNPTGSVEMETCQRLSSVAEMACLDGEGDAHMPVEDDIEKSFRVNQDGSMTVEMKVRLTIKEEETVHWTTTLSRSSVASQMKPGSESQAEEAALLADHTAPDIDPTDSKVIQNHTDEYAFPKECSAAHEEMGRAEEIITVKEPLQPLPSTPGWRKVQQKQSVEGTLKITETDIHESMQGSYAYREETSNGEIKQEHCTVRQSSSRPVPKPRSYLPSEINSAASLQSSTYKSAEILQLQDKEEEVHETVLHIYEQQTCQENFFANTLLCIQGMGTNSSVGGRPVSSDTVFPASSDKTVRSSSEDLESELHASSTYGSLRKQEDSKPSEVRTISTADTSKKKKPVRVIVKKNHIFQITVPERKRKEVDTMKEIKKIRADIFSRAGTMRHTERYRTKAAQKLLKRRNNLANGQRNVPTMSCSPVHLTIQSPNELSSEKEQCTNESDPIQADLFYKMNEIPAPPKKDWLHASSNKCALTRQTSMHEEHHFQRETRELTESISLPALHSSSSVFNEYVELWLQKSEPNQEEVRSTHSELQESQTFLTPLEVKPCSEVSQITSKTVDVKKEASEVALQCHVSLDKTSSQRNHNDSPGRISLHRDSSQENTSLSTRNILKKDTLTRQHSAETSSPQGNTAEEIQLSGNLSLKTSSDVESQVRSRNVPAEDILQNENSTKKNIFQSVSQGETLFARNGSVKSQAISDTLASGKSSKLPLNQEIMPLPRRLKISSYLKDSSLKIKSDNTLEGTSTGNEHEKQMPFPRNPSSKNTVLLNQPSVENIPKNNTLAKASIFNNPTNVEETPLPRKSTLEKKQQLVQSTLMNISKSPQQRDSTKTSEIQQNIISQEGISTEETNKSTSLSKLSDAQAQLSSQTEMTLLQAEKSYTVKMAVRPDMRHVLEELCHSIQSLRDVTQHKRRSCLEKSNSTPDFSSHLASTFGSSSRVLLAFLSVMTLKDGLANLNVCRQDQNNLSCSEALLMLQSLKEMAAIEDAEQLRASLNALQNSTSVQLLQSWRGFQELSNISRTQSVTPGSSRSGSYGGSSSEEEAIQGLMEDLGVPDRVIEELAALCTQEEVSISGNQMEGLEKPSESLAEVKMNGWSLQREKTISFPDSVLEEDVNMYVKSVIENAVKAHLDCGSSDVSKPHKREFVEIKGIEKDNNGLDSYISEDVPSYKAVYEEKHHIPDDRVVDLMERGVVVVSHKKEDMAQNNGKENEIIEEKAEWETCGTKAHNLLEENSQYPQLLNGNERQEAVKKATDAREDDSVAKKDPKSLDSSSSSKDKLTISEEKSSLSEDDNSCDEELMSFSEEHVSDKEENSQMNQTPESKINSMELLSNWKNEGQVNLAQSQPNIKPDSVEKHNGGPELHTTVHTIHTESYEKDKTHYDTEQQNVTYEEKMIYSEEEQVVLEAPECYTIYQEDFVEKNESGPEDTVECEENVVQFNGKKKNTVTELISNLESITETASIITKKPVNKFLAHTEVPDISDTPDITNAFQTSSEQKSKDSRQVRTQNNSDNEKHIQPVSSTDLPKMITSTKQSHIDLTSDPLSSSLAFSYDSRSSSLAHESEGSIQANRVKSIREMFLARNNTTTQNGQRLHSPNSDMSDYQAESSEYSGGNQSHTSPEASSGEDDNSRLAIAKGFVRRTIERLYGRGNSNSTGPDDKRPQSASKARQSAAPGRTHVTTLASFHEARSRVKTDLTYFNATSSLDVFNEPTHCVTLNAQVGHEDAVLIDKGRWLIRETSPELQEPQNKMEKDTTILVEPEPDAVKEDVPYSIFCPVSPHKALSSSELEESAGSLGPKFTYFKLPNASDSELEAEGRNTDSPSKKEAKVTPVTESPKSWVEKNSILPAFNPPVIKKADNKVHPLLDVFKPPVVTQPARGQGAQTNVIRHSTEPDVLEMLFVFCGQHCPIL